ncbi:single-stranded-DNA-specific exonuclease RecJ [bacterium]|nr:single-stranded-DNA-specific exonuclease RecJ [bacterium]
MSLYKNWKIKDCNVSEDISKYCEGNHVLAKLLANRGINTPEKINAFLNPFKAKWLSPDVFTDMQKAYERVKSAIDNKEHITIFGDFDADGVTSTALLYLTLKEIGAEVDYYLPDRTTESHGLNTKALVNIIAKKHSKLIITVDCGISNVNEVSFAKGFKADVIITDHHEAPETLPDAYAILNPKAQNSIDFSLSVDEIQSLNYLAGVGVAFKFACKLLEEYKNEDFVYKILPLAAVGTIGDVVELIGENRSIVAVGLELIKNAKHLGIDKILLSSGISDIKTATSENIAFSVVPRLNAAGRLDSPQTAINVLISEDENEVNEYVKKLDELNTLRQQYCDETFNSAQYMYLKDITNNKKSIILYNENWHIGVIGIVASKLVEKFNKPVFLMTRDPNFPNIIRCSCRSITDINVHSVLSVHKDIFEGFGGHKMAAGFAFDENKIGFEKFKKLLSSTIDEFSQDIDFSQINVEVDMILEPEDITEETVHDIEKLQPFGSGNPSPLFSMNEVALKNFKMMGQENNHLKMYLTKDNSTVMEAVKWNYPDFNLPLNSKLDVLFSLKLNTYNDKTTVQLMVEDIHSELLKQKQTGLIKMLDHRKKKDILAQVFDFATTTKKKTAIYIENPALIKQLNIPEALRSKIFSRNEVPSDIEQLMFFDAPVSKDDFTAILNNSGAALVHLMNFSTVPLSTDTFISKLSGMLKYSVSSLDGILNVERIAKATSVSTDTIDCALTLFDDIGLIDLNKEDELNYKITFIHPIELSKIKESEMYEELDNLINKTNEFRNFYINSPIEDIKEMLGIN